MSAPQATKRLEPRTTGRAAPMPLPESCPVAPLTALPSEDPPAESPPDAPAAFECEPPPWLPFSPFDPWPFPEPLPPAAGGAVDSARLFAPRPAPPLRPLCARGSRRDVPRPFLAVARAVIAAAGGGDVLRVLVAGGATAGPP